MISARNTVPELHIFARTGRIGSNQQADFEANLRAAGYDAITTEILAPRHFIMPRITTSNSFGKTRTVIAAWAEQAWRAPLGLRPSRGSVSSFDRKHKAARLTGEVTLVAEPDIGAFCVIFIEQVQHAAFKRHALAQIKLSARFIKSWPSYFCVLDASINSANMLPLCAALRRGVACQRNVLLPRVLGALSM